MLPLRDINPTRRTPILTWTLILINILVFLWEMSLSDRALTLAFLDLSVVPALITRNPFSVESALDVFRSMFFHGGFAHIAGNMLYLYLFGDNLEDRLGRLLFLVVYFASGVVAVAAQVMINPASQVPLVGASGAIAGVLGGYLVLYPMVRVRGIVPLGFLAFFASLPAWIVLLFWFGAQILNGIASLGADTQMGGGVAFFAHIGGFVAGAFMTFIFMMIVPSPRKRDDWYDMLYDRADRYRF